MEEKYNPAFEGEYSKAGISTVSTCSLVWPTLFSEPGIKLCSWNLRVMFCWPRERDKTFKIHMVTHDYSKE